MAQDYQPFISPVDNMPEITVKGFLLGVFLALIMAVSNTYLALKIGVLTPSSIPAAIISMGILRLFARSNILENNQVQTCASAGEAIAGGIVYTAPALIIIHFWTHFNYLTTFLITAIGGTLGVLFTVPLRRVFMQESHLNFPEARAVAQVLKVSSEKTMDLAHLLLGGGIGAAMELLQNGFKLLLSQISFWVTRGNTLYGFGAGFSATLLGAGYLMGFDVGFSILMGAIIANGIMVPLLSHFSGIPLIFYGMSGNAIYDEIRGNELIYIGIGAMLVSGLWALFTLLKPFYESLCHSLKMLIHPEHVGVSLDCRTERDLPNVILISGILGLLIMSYFLFHHIFPLQALGLMKGMSALFVLTSLFYVLLLGFIFSAICGYFSGLVGVSASPGSAIAIAAALIAALLMRLVLVFTGHLNSEDLKIAAAITIILVSIVMGAASVANNNSQDLKVGHIVGATPWKQQVMLIIGGLVAAFVIPGVMELLYQVYGIVGSFPHGGMDSAQALPAPPAAAMAAVAQGVFEQTLPWNMLGIGATLAASFIVIKRLLPTNFIDLSVIGIAIGMYLPLSSSIPLFLGSLIHYFVKRKLQSISSEAQTSKFHRGMVLSCGLVAGAAVMNVLLAIPFAFLHNPNALALVSTDFHRYAGYLSIGIIAILCGFLYFNIIRAE